MTRRPVPSDARALSPAPTTIASCVKRAGLAFLALATAVLAAPALEAEPLALKDDADIARLAEKIDALSGVRRLEWIVAANAREDAEAAVARIGAALPPGKRNLVKRVRAQTFVDAAPDLSGAPAPLAWVSPVIGTAGGPTCSWQVWVTDPTLPSLKTDAPVAVPLTPNERMPVGPAATFRVGHSGLLQSKLYAFDETRPGAIRDLATVPDVDIPVASDPTGETIFLAIARETAPFLDALKSSLAASPGQRKDLGKEYALRERLLGQGRGIGANIQIISPNLLAPRTGAKAVSAASPSPGETGPLAETCLFGLTPVN